MIRPAVTARRVGNEQQAVVVVDGFHPNPDTLRACAATVPFGPAGQHYPGVRAVLPADYFAQVRPTLSGVLTEVFGYRAIGLIDASFSIVTTAPGALSVHQRLPHVDSVEPDRVALVHYLAPEDRDGTAFFRHRATGYETVAAARSSDYHARLNAELQRDGAPPAAYIGASTPLFERTAVIEARYNRAIIYRSAMLHSGAIAPEARLADDPVTGRLTVTAFFAPE